MSKHKSKNNEKGIKEIKKLLVSVLKKEGIKKAGIFGSYARGEADKNSDVDILIEIKDKKFSLFDLVALERRISEIIKRKVDLLTYNSINHLLKERIMKEEVRII